MLELRLVACHSYRSSDPRHLKFPVGACISAKPGQEGNPLWLGRFAGRQGWFPASYCRIQPWSPVSSRQALRTRSLDDYDFSREARRHRPDTIERRCKSVEETAKKKSPPIDELFVPNTPKVTYVHSNARTFFEESEIFAKVDRFVEELGQSSSEFSLPELLPVSATRRPENAGCSRVAETNTGISESRQDDPSSRVSPTGRRPRPRRCKSTGGSWLQGLKDIRNIVPRKNKRNVRKNTTSDDNGIVKICSSCKATTPIKETPPVVYNRSTPLKVEDTVEPVDPIEVLAAEFRARAALAPL